MYRFMINDRFIVLAYNNNDKNIICIYNKMRNALYNIVMYGIAYKDTVFYL